MVVLARVDDRLIHGQVVVGWVPAVKANHIVVIHDSVVADTMQQSFMRMAVPSKIKVSFLSVEEAPLRLKNEASWQQDRLLLLFGSPVDAAAVVRSGYALKELNVGGMRYARGKREMAKGIFLNREDAEALAALLSCGVHVVGRVVPTDSSIDVVRWLTAWAVMVSAVEP